MNLEYIAISLDLHSVLHSTLDWGLGIDAITRYVAFDACSINCTLKLQFTTMLA